MSNLEPEPCNTLLDEYLTHANKIEEPSDLEESIIHPPRTEYRSGAPSPSSSLCNNNAVYTSPPLPKLPSLLGSDYPSGSLVNLVDISPGPPIALNTSAPISTSINAGILINSHHATVLNSLGSSANKEFEETFIESATAMTSQLSESSPLSSSKGLYFIQSGVSDQVSYLDKPHCVMGMSGDKEFQSVMIVESKENEEMCVLGHQTLDNLFTISHRERRTEVQEISYHAHINTDHQINHTGKRERLRILPEYQSICNSQNTKVWKPHFQRLRRITYPKEYTKTEFIKLSMSDGEPLAKLIESKSQKIQELIKIRLRIDEKNEKEGEVFQINNSIVNILDNPVDMKQLRLIARSSLESIKEVEAPRSFTAMVTLMEVIRFLIRLEVHHETESCLDGKEGDLEDIIAQIQFALYSDIDRIIQLTNSTNVFVARSSISLIRDMVVYGRDSCMNCETFSKLMWCMTRMSQSEDRSIEELCQTCLCDMVRAINCSEFLRIFSVAYGACLVNATTKEQQVFLMSIQWFLEYNKEMLTSSEIDTIEISPVRTFILELLEIFKSFSAEMDEETIKILAFTYIQIQTYFYKTNKILINQFHNSIPRKIKTSANRLVAGA